MAITTQEADEIKQQLLKQLGKFPEEKQAEIKNKVDAMSVEEVEKLVEDEKLHHLGGKCIFCAIAAGTMPSYKIAENAENVAVLEINPLSRGHCLIIPKEHAEKQLESTNELANEVAKLLAEKLTPKKIHINEVKLMDHALLEVIPLFGDESERKPATAEQLEKLKQEILKPKELKIETAVQEEKMDAPLYRLPPRIP